MTEEQYNRQLLRVCKEEGIKVIGLADHGNVEAVDAIREAMKTDDVIVFPGFEIASSEKAHFVCLFPEDSSRDQLNRYLGGLGLLDPEDGVRPSRFSGEELLQKVDEMGGFAFSAHCTNESGVLFRKLNNVWTSKFLKAAQIPGTLDDLKTEAGQGYRQILMNKNPAYKREKPAAIINAKDVAWPDDLKNPKASCLIKMTRPCFDSFKHAFLDPGSRVRLNSDAPENYYSRVESVRFTGGYLDGVEIEFSEHLNSIIGGRGTGKSTLLECIRYALEMRPTGKNASKQHKGIIKENLGKEKGRVEVAVRSSAMNGKRFLVSRRYGESTIVKNENSDVSSFTAPELLPGIEIYGQNEIHEIAQDPRGQRKLLHRFLDIDHRGVNRKLSEISLELRRNRKEILNARKSLADVENDVAMLPKLREQLAQFEELGVEKLNVIPDLEREKNLSQRVGKELEALAGALDDFKERFPDTLFLGDSVLEGLPHAKILKKIRGAMDKLERDLDPAVSKLEDVLSDAGKQIEKQRKQLEKGVKEKEDALERAFKEIPACQDRSGKEIGVRYQELLKEKERIRPREVLLNTRQTTLNELKRRRSSLLAELSEARADRSAHFQRSLKKLNRKLSGKLKLTVDPEADRTPLVDFLQKCNLDGVGPKRLAWIETAEDFSPMKLVELIRKGADELQNAGWGVPPSAAEALAKLHAADRMELEALELPDTITIELNVAREGSERYRRLDKLSTGQQCTALLHILLIENPDPLLMDQPEDNLDNAFIADRIVAELRSAKVARQFIFATHNANIPVFGDAEWIGVFHADENRARLPATLQGAIDLEEIQHNAAEILEGGKAAFIQRKEKYGF